MKTRVINITDPKSQSSDIEEAAQFIKKGEVVAFPTETVYGLGANALDAQAVKKIFQAKGRPGDNPLIVHISDIYQWQDLVDDIPDKALELAENFWPGPLTIILEKSLKVPVEVTAGLDTVGVRMPAHPVARELINLAGVPIAAPSANRSGRPSPTTARHVLEDLDGRIPIILDGGQADVGVESTVLDMTGDVPVILRPGGVTPEMLKEIVGQVKIDPHVMAPLVEDKKVRSPGMKYIHYAPKASVVLIRGDLDKLINFISQETRRQIQAGKRVGILATDQTINSYYEGVRLTMGDRDKPRELAANLFARLREFDELNVDIILAEAVDEKGEGLAVMNRIARAAGFHIIDL
ncbi:MAG TPA: threonylcarbamoyl-AMP synthase [Clostridiales bacterium]|nr:threonylcarbamoyl-AMP synthase [Clostridiales bacterium]